MVDRRAVEQVDAPALPQPAPVDPGVQVPPDGAGHGGEEPLGQALPGLAVRPGLGGARPLPPGDAVGDQAGDGGPAGLVGAEDLAEEDPQGDQRGEDPVQPPADGGQRLGEDLLGEDVGERQAAVLEELPPEEVGLLAERSGVGRPHGRGSVPGGPNPIFTREDPATYPPMSSRLAEL